MKLFTLPSPGGFPLGTGLADPAPAPKLPAAAATDGVYQRPTVASEEQLRSSWSWNGLNLVRQTVCAWPLSSISAAPLGPALRAQVLTVSPFVSYERLKGELERTRAYQASNDPASAMQVI